MPFHHRGPFFFAMIIDFAQGELSGDVKQFQHLCTVFYPQFKLLLSVTELHSTLIEWDCFSIVGKLPFISLAENIQTFHTGMPNEQETKKTSLVPG